jgi:integrase
VRATRKRIGVREVAALQPNQIVWDSAVRGFAARRQKGATVSYVVFYRTREGLQRWHTIGRHGQPWTPDTARAEARRVLGLVASGDDPAGAKQATRHAATVTELCDRYLADARSGRLLTRRGVSKTPSTLVTDAGRIERHIKPLLGKRHVAGVTREDVDQFMHDVASGKSATRIKTKKRGVANVRGGRGTASRTLGLLGAIFTYAVRKGLRESNPVHGVVRFADKRRTRRLSDDEYARLGAALEQARAELWPPAVDAARFLALTGWRRGEALTLKWTDIDLARRTATLSDTKTGRSVRPLSTQACDLLRGIQTTGALVFPASRGDGPMGGFNGFWKKLRAFGDLPPDVTPHVLRHSFASVAVDLGYSELTIAALLGHRRGSITADYAHHADAVLLAAADAVADAIAKAMCAAVSSD